MRVYTLLAIVVLATTVAGCLRAGPPKTPNQRAVEAEQARRDRAAGAPAPAPILPAREPPPVRGN